MVNRGSGTTGARVPRQAITSTSALAVAMWMTVAGQPHGAWEPASRAVFQSGPGSKIAFSTDRDGRDAPDEIYVMNTDGTNEVRLTVTPSGNSLFPEWSPDGQLIAFHNNPVEVGSPEIFLVVADGTAVTTRLTYMASLGLAALNPTWSPDGKRIAFNSQDALGNRDLWAINVDGSGLVQLTSDAANEAQPDWSPDGRQIAFNSNRSGNTEIYVMPADGGHDANDWVQLTSAPGADIGADWSPSGQLITFESQRDGNREIYVMRADGSGPRRVTFDTRPDAFPSWSPDGSSVAFHRQLLTIPGLNPPNGSEIFAVDVNSLLETRITYQTPDSFSAFASWAPGHAQGGS